MLRKNRKIYASDTDRHPAGGAASPPRCSTFRPFRISSAVGYASEALGMDLRSAASASPSRCPADGRRDAADRPGRHARRLRPTLAGRGPVAADPKEVVVRSFEWTGSRPATIDTTEVWICAFRRTAFARGDPPTSDPGPASPDHLSDGAIFLGLRSPNAADFRCATPPEPADPPCRFENRARHRRFHSGVLALGIRTPGTARSRLRADVSAGPGILRTGSPLHAALRRAFRRPEHPGDRRSLPAAIPPALNDRTVG